MPRFTFRRGALTPNVHRVRAEQAEQLAAVAVVVGALKNESAIKECVASLDEVMEDNLMKCVAFVRHLVLCLRRPLP